ncbi:MAG: 6-bladed beta-propeller [Rubrivivax sp.]|nr:6-bladed beta-propeller [Rubrivivax sp.]
MSLPLVVGACAAPAGLPGAAAAIVKGRLVPDLGEVPEGHRITWPATPEVPRYLYGGALTGEPNFKRDEPARGALQRLGRWIAGLDETPAAPLVLQRPAAVVGDDDGRLYVSDAGRQAIFVFDAAAGELLLWDQAAIGLRFAAPSGMAVQASPAVAPGAPGASTASGASGTSGASGAASASAAPGPSGTSTARLYVADAELRAVFVLDASGRPLARVGEGRLQRPTGVARDARSGRLFVADTARHTVEVFDAEGRHLRTLGRRGENAGEFNFPTHLALRDGRLYVTDTLNNRVQVLDVSEGADTAGPAFGRFVRSVGARGLFVGNLVRPKGVAVDGEGNVYVVESFYDSVLVFSAEGEFLMPITGTGTGTGAVQAFGGTAAVAAPSAGPFYLPAGLWIDGRNRVHVADMFNGRIVLLHFLGGG